MLLYGLWVLVFGCLMCLLGVCFYTEEGLRQQRPKPGLADSGFVKTRDCCGCLVSQAQKKPGLGRSYLRIIVSEQRRCLLLASLRSV